MDSTTMKGTVQGYFDRAFDEMTDKELETPLARGCERSALRVSSAKNKEP